MSSYIMYLPYPPLHYVLLQITKTLEKLKRHPYPPPLPHSHDILMFLSARASAKTSYVASPEHS